MLNALIENLNTIKNARNNIKLAIENKGAVGVTNDITTYANLIDNISGGSSGDVKLFETQEEMQNDPDVHEGDKAVVYRSEINNAQGDSVFSKATFPNTVILPEAFTGNTMVAYRSTDGSHFDMWGELSQTGFRLSGFGEQGKVRIEYTSKDGITYTRTDGGDEEVDFGVEVQREAYEEWNDVFGYFIKIGENTFEGLYTANNIPIKLKGVKLSDLVLINSEIQIGETINIDYSIDELSEKLYTMASYIKNTYNHDTYGRYPFLILVKNNIISFVCDGSSINSVMYASPLFVNNNFNSLVAASWGDLKFYEFQFNINTNEFITVNEITDTIPYTYDSGFSDYQTINLFNNYYYLAVMDVSERRGFKIEYAIQYMTNDNSYGISGSKISLVYGIKYIMSSNQFSLNNSNQLLPGVKALGMNGVVEGDGSIYQTLDTLQYYNTITGNIYKKSNIVLTTNEINVPAYIKPVNSISGAVLLQYKTKIIPENSESTFYFPLMFEFSKGYVFYYGLTINENTSYYIDILDLNYNVIKHTAIEYGDDVFFINSKLFEIENNIYIPYKSNTGSGIRIIKIDSENNISRVVLSNSRVADTHFMLDKDLQNIVFLDTNGIFMYDLEGNKVYEDTTTYKDQPDSGIMTSDSNYIYIITHNMITHNGYLYLIDKSTKTKLSFTKLTDILPNYKRSLNNSNQLYLVTLENNKSMVYKMNGTTPTKVYEYNSNFSLLNSSEFFEDEGYIFSRGYHEVDQLNSYKIIKSDSENNLLNEEDNVNRTKSILLDLNNRIFGTKLLKKGNKFIGHQVTDTGDIYKIIIDTKSEISHDTTGNPMIPYNKSYDKYDKNIGNISWFILSQFDEEDNSSL